MIKIAIIDDSTESIDRCVRIIKSSYETLIDVIDTFESGKTFLNSIENRYNIIILDIDMPDIDGFDVANEIRKRSSDTLIMFYTAHEQYVYKSFEFQPFRYIRKEKAEMELPFALKCAFMQIRENIDKDIYLKVGDTSIKLNTSDIMLFEKYKHNLEILCSSGEKIIVRKTLDEFLRYLENDRFIYAHKSAVVNLKYIKKVTPTDIILEDDTKIPISRRNFKSIRLAFIKYIGEQI